MTQQKEFDVHFSLNGFMRITAESEDSARSVVNEMISSRISAIEKELSTSLSESSGNEIEDFTTDVLEA